MRVFAKFSADGDPLAFYSDDVWAVRDMPAGLVEITAEQRWEFTSNPGRHRWDGSAVVAYDPPPPPVPPAITFKADIWRRATDAEAETLDGMLAAQPARLRNLYRDAQQIVHSDDLFPVLHGAMAQAFGSKRADELLAPS